MNNKRKTSSTFIVGAIITVLLSFFVGYINIGVFFLFGIPLFILLLGLLFTWIGRAAVYKKIVVTALIIPLIAGGLITFLTLNAAEPEVFLIPQDFRGEFYVVLNETCGGTYYENNARVYRIRADGILVTNFDRNRGILNRKFFLVDELGNRTVLEDFGRRDFETEQEDRRSTWGKEPITKETLGVLYMYGGPHNTMSYTVTNYTTLAQKRENEFLYYQEKEKQVEEKTKLCRASIK